MVSKRTLITSFLVAAIAIGAGAAVMAPASAQADDGESKLHVSDCAKLKHGKAKAKCGTGKNDNVAKWMKELKKEYKKAEYEGIGFDCGECHTNSKGEALRPNGTKTGGKKPADVLDAFLAGKAK